MRHVWKSVIGLMIVISLGLCSASLYKQGISDPTGWATVAAALAVIAAAVSAWTGQRVVEMQEDALQPSLLPSLDVRSRMHLVQFKIENCGGSHAFDVSVTFDRPLPGLKGPILLGVEKPIAMIPKGDNASVLVTSTIELFTKQTDTTYTGTIKYRNSRGRRFSEPFTITGEHERSAMALATDEQERHQDIERMRKALEDIAKSLDKLRPIPQPPSHLLPR